MRALLFLTSLCCAVLVAASAAEAQGSFKRPVLEGEKATIVFSPEGGYAPQNYLKQYKKQGQTTWATQNGALAELIRRAPKGGKIRIGSFKLSDQEVIDALFWAAEQRNVEVKLWLKGPPGLTYMVAKHEAIAAQANRYLRRRAQQGKESVWGDFQVQIGTAAKMNASGKRTDMHQKFGVVSLDAADGPGKNHGFLGTSNIGSSSDLYHNENRVFFLNNALVSQRLWQEFDRLWKHFGEGRTYKGGDTTQGTNVTPEATPRIKLASGGFADEPADAALQVRFTNEKQGNTWHRISDDYVETIREARHLPAGSTVWVAQFGFGVSKISNAIERAARDNPQVTFKVMAHMAEGDSWALRQLAQSGHANLKVFVKWASSKLKLSKGARPGVPGPTDPGPSLLHHKTLVLGNRLMITGSYNFFGDADDQCENIVIVRAHRDPSYSHLLADTHAEFEAMQASGVLIDAQKLYGNKGLFDAVRAYSNKPGFLEVLRRLPTNFTTEADVLKLLRNSGNVDLAALDAATLKDYLDVAQRFEFAERDASQRVRLRPDPDSLAHTAKPGVRSQAKDAPTAQVYEGTLQGGGVLRVAGVDYTLPGAVSAQLSAFTGRTARVRGLLSGTQLGEVEVLSPLEGSLTGVASTTNNKRSLSVDGKPVEAFGSVARLLDKVSGKRATVRGAVFRDAAGKPTAIEVTALAAKAKRSSRVYRNYVFTGHRLKEGDAIWITRAPAWSRWVKMTHGEHEGYVYLPNLDLSAKQGLADQFGQ
jgi:phosphatidylserine/phosphatidylglycerophosphate/cardiolipin synthase-like enzyme